VGAPRDCDWGCELMIPAQPEIVKMSARNAVVLIRFR
jgi:hypothetical protein